MTLRNCSKCGNDFQIFSSVQDAPRICGNCRCPRVQQSRRTEVELLGQPLTVREKQIVDKVCEAKLNKEIAHELHLAEGTVKVFLSTIFCKTGVSNRTALAIWGIRNPERTVVEPYPKSA